MCRGWSTVAGRVPSFDCMIPLSVLFWRGLWAVLTVSELVARLRFVFWSRVGVRTIGNIANTKEAHELVVYVCIPKVLEVL